MPQAMKIPAAKVAVDKEWKNWRQFQHGIWKIKSKKELTLEAQRDKKKVHFASFMDICHLKKCGVGTKITEVQRQSRASVRDFVKDDSRAYAVFTEQGSSASQMIAAKIMDVVARLPGCDGQAAGAVSAYAQVKLEDAKAESSMRNCRKSSAQNKGRNVCRIVAIWLG